MRRWCEHWGQTLSVRSSSALVQHRFAAGALCPQPLGNGLARSAAALTRAQQFLEPAHRSISRVRRTCTADSALRRGLTALLAAGATASTARRSSASSARSRLHRAFARHAFHFLDDAGCRPPTASATPRHSLRAGRCGCRRPTPTGTCASFLISGMRARPRRRRCGPAR